MVRRRHALIVGAVALLLVATLAFGGGWVAARTFGTTPVDSLIASLRLMGARQETPPEVRDEFAVFWQVWSIVEGEFYRPAPLDRQRMVYGAIRGVLASLEDEYTTFQEPEAAAVSRESMQGRFEGIGAYLRYEAGEILIDRPFRRSPAEQAGLLAGDAILAVDGEPMAQIIGDLSEAEATAAAAEQIRGPKGSVVMLTLRREQVAEPFDVAITRDELPVITVNAELLDDGVAYIQITEFKASTTELLDETLRELIPQNPESIVLDLRNNSGGFLQTAREVLGRFYTGVALYEHENGGVVKEITTISGPTDARLFDIPMVVLINGGSASAAEIVAGALRDMRPNTSLLGEQTFGKGSVQNIHQLRDGSSVRVTVAHWYTPGGTEINRVGLIPEHVVAASADATYAVPCVANRRPAEGQDRCVDAQLVWGLRLLNGNPPPPPPRTGTLPTPQPRKQAA